MGIILSLLNICSALASAMLLFFAVLLPIELISALVQHRKVNFGQFNFFRLCRLDTYNKILRVGGCLLCVALCVGIPVRVLKFALANNEIGSFFERSSYQTTYEAQLKIDKKTVFCLVDVRKDIEFYEEDRRFRSLTKIPILLPGGSI